MPVVLGEHVTMDAGTGAVHTAPAHGQDDYVMGKKYNLPLENPVGNDGCFISTTPLFAGMHVNQVNERIIELLVILGQTYQVNGNIDKAQVFYEDALGLCLQKFGTGPWSKQKTIGAMDSIARHVWAESKSD